jgi:dihydrofolate reductase
MRISVIAAIGERNRVIGRDNDLPWSGDKKLKQDMRRFTALTRGHPVIMGRRTWESIEEKYRPLPGRTNFVVTRSEGSVIPGAHVAYSVCGALQRAEHFPGNEEVFVIGGAEVYERGLRHAHRLYLTLVDEDAEGDTFFPEYPRFTREIERIVVPDSLPRLTFLTLERGPT